MSESSYAIAYISLGSNLSDRRDSIEKAVELLGSYRQVELVRQSRLIETAPIGGPAGQGNFLNGALHLRTSLTPDELLALMLAVEACLGRVRAEKWGPRIIDLDLLLYDDLIIDKPGLKLPHPLMHQRRFVLTPLAEIAPQAYHPILKKNIRQILEDFEKNDKL